MPKPARQLAAEIRAALALRGVALDRKMARQSLREEREAIHAYGRRIPRAHSAPLKRALQHARREEREHAAAFQQALKRL